MDNMRAEVIALRVVVPRAILARAAQRQADGVAPSRRAGFGTLLCVQVGAQRSREQLLWGITMGRGVYDDRDGEWKELAKWGQPKKKWEKGHAVYHEPDLNHAQSLYKYIKAADAFLMLRNRTLWFSSPYRWDDPHEAWWCEQLFRKGSHLATATAYGSCWTRRYRDEPFWRMYSCECKEDDDGAPNKREPVRVLPAVRLRANTGRLFDWLRHAASRETCKAYMGHVRYCPTDQLKAEAKRLQARHDNASPSAATALLMKRLAFAFEDEVRMLWIDRRPRRPGRAFPFDPLTLFDQVMIGPTKEPARYREVAAKLVDLGVPAGIIGPSSIANPPDLT